MARCAGTKRDGGQCTTIVKPPNTHCYQHDPARSEERRRNASRAGRSAGGREIRGLKQEVRDLIAGVKAGEQDRGAAAVMLQGFRVLKDYVQLEIKIKEVDELEARLEALERAAGEQKGGQRWGA